MDINKVNNEKSMIQLQEIKNPIIKIRIITNELQLAVNPMINIIFISMQIKIEKHIQKIHIETKKNIQHKTIKNKIIKKIIANNPSKAIPIKVNGIISKYNDII